MIHKELLTEIIEKWDERQISNYIIQLETRVLELNHWIKELRVIRKKKVKKSPLDTGARDGR